MRLKTSAVPLSAFFLIATFSYAQTDTTYITGGTISSDSTWTVAKSPYIITGDITINTDVTLTIEPGVKVLFEQGDDQNQNWDPNKVEIWVGGTLKAIGTETDSIYFDDINGERTSDSWGMIALDWSTGKGEFKYCSFKNSDWQAIRVLNADSLSVTNSTFSNCSYGIYFERQKTPLTEGNTKIEHNVFKNNSRGITYRYHFGRLLIQYNDFHSNSDRDVTIENHNIAGAKFRAHYNNFYDDGASGDIVENQTLDPADMRYNYWGPTATAEMEAGGNPKDISRIYDYYDDNNRGVVNYSHWLDAPWPDGKPAAQDTVSAEILITDNQYTEEALTYHSGDSIFFQITDSDRNTDDIVPDQVTLEVWSESETSHETITITETDLATGIFRGYLPLDDISGVPFSDQKLQVSHGDWMYFQFIDPYNDWGLADTLLSGKVFEVTVIKGVDIYSDSTWTVAGGPYLITGDVRIYGNSTLTIDPGVTVYFYPYYDDRWYGWVWGLSEIFIESGKLSAIGTATDSIIFQAYSISPQPSSWGAITFMSDCGNSDLVTSTIQYARIEGAQTGVNRDSGPDTVRVFNTLFKNNQGDIRVWNPSQCQYGISPLLIKNCVVYNQSSYWSVDIDGDVVLENNDFLDPEQSGNLLYVNPYYDITIRENNFYASTWGGIQIAWGSYGSELDLRYNYWDSTATAEMNAGGNPKNISIFYDYFDDSNRGMINYSRWLDTPWPTGTSAAGGHTGDLKFIHSDGRRSSGYRDGDTLFVRLYDPDLNTDINTPEIARVEVWSDLETTAEILSLYEVEADTGLFTGWMRLDQNTGYALSDGILQVDLNNWIRTSYKDALDDWNNTDTTVVDSVQYHFQAKAYESDANTVLLLHFDADTGQTVKDASNNANHGYFGSSESDDSDDPEWSTRGVAGGCVYFDGTSHIRIPHDSSLNISGDQITIEMWVNFPSPATENDWFLAKYGNVSYRAMTLYFQSGRFYGALSIDNNNVEVGLSNNPIDLNRWYHIAMTYDGSAMKFYIDGDSVGVYQVSGQLTLDQNTGNPYLYLGSHHWSDQNATLYMDEVRISKVVRSSFGVTADQIAPGIAAGFYLKDSTSNSITLEWHAPGDDRYTGTATRYDLRRSASLIDSANFQQADSLTGLPIPGPAGTPQSFKIKNLPYSTTYYFALKTIDDAALWSPISNIVTGHTEPQDTTAPGAVSSLIVSSTGTRQAILTWAAPADDGQSGRKVQGYSLHYSKQAITSANFFNTDSITVPPATLAPGTNQADTIPGLDPNASYYIAIRSYDEVPNWSTLSNTPQATTAPVPVLGAGPWPTFHGNSQNTGYYSKTGAVRDSLVWSYSTGGQIASSPALDAEENSYVGSEDGYLYSLDPEGTLRWKKNLGGGVFSTPTIATGGYLYVGSKSNGIYCLSQATGDTVWTFITGGQIFSSPVIAASPGLLLCGSLDGKLYALQTEDGKEVWTYSTASKVYNSPALSAGDSTVYFGSQGGTLYAVDARTGEQRWDFSIGSAIYSSPAVDSDGSIIIAAQNGKVYSISSSGSQNWEYTTGSSIFYSSPAIQTGSESQGMITSLPEVSENEFRVEKGRFRPGGDLEFGEQEIIKPRKGKARSTRLGDDKFTLRPEGLLPKSGKSTLENRVSPKVLQSSSRVYIGADDGKLYCLNASDGTEVWTYSTSGSGAIRNAPVVSGNGYVYFGSADSTFYCVDINGNLKWSHTTGGELYTSSPALGSTGQVYIGSYDNKLYALGVVDIFLAQFRSLSTAEYSDSVDFSYKISNPANTIVTIHCEYSDDDGDTWKTPTIRGDTTGITPENYFNSITWDTHTDLPGLDLYTVKFKIEPYYLDSTGIAAITPSLHIDNNEVPSISITPIEEEMVGNIPVVFTLSDQENDTLSLVCEYTELTDTSWQAASIQGNVAGITTYSDTITWLSDSDLSEFIGNLYFRLTPKDNDAGVADTVTILIDQIGASVVSEVLVPEGELSGVIQVDYTLTDDEGDSIDIKVEYSLDGGGTWNPATTSGDTAGLDSAHYSGSFSWLSGEDTKGIDSARVQLKLTPWDGHWGADGSTGFFHLDNNLPPTVSLGAITTEQSGDVPITIDLQDEEDDSVYIELQYLTATGTEWKDITSPDFNTPLKPSDFTGEVTWESNADLPDVEGEVELKIASWDLDPGASDTISFPIDNLAGPYATSLNPTDQTLTIWRDTIFIQFNEPIDEASLSANVKVEAKIAGTLEPQFNLWDDDKALTLTFDQYFTTWDTVVVKLFPGVLDTNGIPFDGNGNGDPDGEPEDILEWSFYTAMGGDYDLDGLVNFDDFLQFRDGWLEQDQVEPTILELYPFTGEVPHITVDPDGSLNIYDLATFATSWTWWHQNAASRLAARKRDSDSTPPIRLVSNFATDYVWNARFGNELEIDLQFVDQRPVEALELILEYNPAHLEFDQIRYSPELSCDGCQWIQLDYQDEQTGLIIIDLASFAPGVVLDQELGSLGQVVFTPLTDTESTIAYGVDSRERVDSRLTTRYSAGEYSFQTRPPIPSEYTLHHNYPNPFNPITNIRYEIPQQSDIRLIIYDLLGREVKRLVNTHQREGYYEVRWDGTDAAGRKVSSGMYFYAIQASTIDAEAQFRQVKKLILLK